MFGLAIILFLTVLGQFARLPIFGGIMASDIFMPLFAAGWIVIRMFKPTVDKHQPLFAIPLILFFAIAGFSLLQSRLFLSWPEMLDGLLYFVRLLSYGILAFIVYDTIRTGKDWRKLFGMMVFSGVLIALAGFVQLTIYPDFKPMEVFGWDAHKNRLLSTWFDPNIVGGLFAFLLPLITFQCFSSKSKKEKGFLAVSGIIIFAALLFTFSRSSYLAFAVGFFVLGIIKARKTLVAGVLAVVLFLSFSPYARERVLQMTESIASVLTQGQIVDVSSGFRLESWRNAITLWKEHPFFGIGYNNFEAVQLREGMLQKPGLHHASGSDSSWLNILATTGIFGFLVFLFFYFRLMHLSLRTGNIGLFAALAALFVHSQFVNSLFFPLLMPYFLISIALLERLTISRTASGDTVRSSAQKHIAAFPHSSVSR